MGDVLGSLWMVFLWVPWGGWGRGRETSGHVQQGRFSLDDTRSQITPFFVLYIIY